MLPETAVALHVGHGQAVTFAGYLSRVVFHLVALSGAALLVYWSVERVDGVRPAFASGDDDEAVEDGESRPPT